MFKPWIPLESELEAIPQIDWSVQGRTLNLIWVEWKNGLVQLEAEIYFKNGIAGVFCIDESTYLTASEKWLPSEKELYRGELDRRRYSAWKSDLNFRKHLYGGLGDVNYINMYSYYLVGCDTVLLVDIADSEAIINVKKS